MDGDHDCAGIDVGIYIHGMSGYSFLYYFQCCLTKLVKLWSFRESPPGNCFLLSCIVFY